MKFAWLRLIVVFALTLTGLSAFGQELDWSIYSDTYITNVGGESQRQAVSSAVFNNEIWVAYTSTSCNIYGCYVELVNNGGSGMGFENPVKVPASDFASGYVESTENPALTVLNGVMYLAFTDDDDVNYVMATSDGVNWTEPFGGITTGYSTVASPSLAVNPSNTNELYMGYMSGTSYNLILCTFTPNLSNWDESTVSCQNPAGFTHEVNFTPGMVFYNGLLYLGFEDRGSSHCLYLYTDDVSTNTFTFIDPAPTCGQQTSYAPALAVQSGYLYIAYRSNDSSNSFLVLISTNGSTFPYSQDPGWGTGGGPNLLAPASDSPANIVGFATYENELYYILGQS